MNTVNQKTDISEWRRGRRDQRHTIHTLTLKDLEETKIFQIKHLLCKNVLLTVHQVIVCIWSYHFGIFKN